MIVFADSPGNWRFTLQLHHGASEVVARPANGVQVRLRSGQLWITHDGDPRDVVLEPEQSYTAQRGERMMLHAVKDSEIEMQFSRAE
ncbi:MAG TPA: DUF2917 domain-containing protein [Ramlibacter sp.]|uniref:DUF2917 domain-containing protein n=1 Tax=Ramlibacter sp. TaxID=1917967 RepID=UPI002BD70091|nr:DUF2917 domain-containing protein [Ramlibacter sp.]HVZ44788.1 DUF2917 domain-containing protein [Ramlibacter sp.]